MRTFLFIFAAAVMHISQVYSQPVSLREAEETAQNFFGKTHKSLQTCADMSIDGSDTLFYVFNATNAFVVISADKKAIPILAYSTESSYDADHVIPPVKMWLDYYRQQLLAIRKDEAFCQSPSVGKAWKNLQQPTKMRKSTTSNTPTPLLTSNWGQGKPYNYYCPKDAAGPNGRVVTGCVATAMAQLMYYFRFPTQGEGSYEYTWEPYGKLSADFGNAVYDYSAMIDEPSEINPAISLLMYHCGVAVDMEYGPDGSGMTNHSAAYVLNKYFHFSPQTQYVFREITDLDWDSLIVSHIDNKIPLYYAGWGDANAGHAFVCDAYQIDSNNNYYYHFNFGWDGQANGYFYTNNLHVGGYNFTLWQEIIINAYPDTLQFKYPNPLPLTGTTVLTTETGSFTDGTIYDCPQNMNYTWIIRPDVDDIENIAFDIQYKLAEGDTIVVVSADGKTNRTFTNETSTFSANIVDTEVRVNLKTTNDTAYSGGFSANYAVKRKIYCTGLSRRLTAKQGTIDDGSGNSRYSNLTSCKWTISVTGAHSITIRFSKFETEKDKDILSISDLSQGVNPILLTQLSGNLTDSAYTFNTNYLAFLFETDEKNIFQGWTLFYNTDLSNTTIDFEDDKKINSFPNPVNGNFFIDVSEPLTNGNVQLFDMYGKLLKKQAFDEKQLQLNVSDIAPGVYVVKIIEENRVLKIVKLVKE